MDSFATIREYTEDVPEEYKLTHLLFFKIGAHHGSSDWPSQELEDRLFREELEVAEKYCNENDFPLVVVESNINQLSYHIFGTYSFDQTCLYRNVGVMLMLQTKFSKYVVASSYTGFSNFKLGVEYGLEPSEQWSVPLLSTESLAVLMGNKAMSRMDKTAYISKYSPSYDHLMVCWKSSTNCGECKKCIRTLVALDILGVLDKYHKSFDLEKYRKKKKEHWKTVVALSDTDYFFREIVDYMSGKGTPQPNWLFSVIWYYWVKKKSVKGLLRALYVAMKKNKSV